MANAGPEHPRWECGPRPGFLRMLGDQRSSAAVLWSLRVFPSPTLYFLVDRVIKLPDMVVCIAVFLFQSSVLDFVPEG